MNVQVVRMAEPERGFLGRLIDRFRPRQDVGRDVARWQAELSRRAGVPVSWDDDPNREYFTDKPAWDCYGALLLWAAYEERGATKYPETAEKWEENPIFGSLAGKADSKYCQLLGNTEIWVPAKIHLPMTVPALAGDSAVVGSVNLLADQLRALNEATWKAGEETLSQWRQEGAEHGAPLETSARFGFAVFSELAALAVQHRLPMKLDY
ncbi:MAG: hypothetical protein ACJ76N_32330 [Thermoanaerobaculia bacterium]